MPTVVRGGLYTKLWLHDRERERSRTRATQNLREQCPLTPDSIKETMSIAGPARLATSMDGDKHPTINPNAALAGDVRGCMEPPDVLLVSEDGVRKGNARKLAGREAG